MNIVKLAEQTAKDAHKGQVRKNSGLPYYVHVDGVRKIVKNWLQKYAPIAKDGKMEDFNRDFKNKDAHAIRARIYLQFQFRDEENKMHFIKRVEVISLWHDIIEDVEDYDLKRLGLILRHDVDVPIEEINPILEVVDILTKREGEKYIDYLARVKTHETAILVKLADLEHNMSDLADGTLKDKYELARQYLLR